MKTYLQIGELQLPSYGLCIVLGVVIANIIAYLVLKKKKLCVYDFIILEAYTMLGAFGGAKLLYLWVSRELIEWNRIFETQYLNQVMKGGFVFYGGLIGGLITAYICGKVHKIKLSDYIRTFIFAIPIIHGFGRVGCYMAGCCYGRPYDGIIAVMYPENSLAPSGISLFPVQLVEAICLLVIGIVLFYFTYVKDYLYTLEMYLISYSILRFVLEYYRYDSERGSFLFFSTSQWISIGIIVVLGVKKIWDNSGCKAKKNCN